KTTANVQVHSVVKGMYAVNLRVTDVHGAYDEIVKSFTVGDLSIRGQVSHTPEWEAYRIGWNERFPGQSRDADTFWAGEAFVLHAVITDTGESTTKPLSVTAELLGTGKQTVLSGTDGVHYEGMMLDASSADSLDDGVYTMRFRVQYS